MDRRGVARAGQDAAAADAGSIGKAADAASAGRTRRAAPQPSAGAPRMDAARAEALIGFLALADRLKHVLRRGVTLHPADGTRRRENSAEHSWSVALLAVLLHGEVADPPDLGRVLAMVAAHDLVEVEAGDTFAYDPEHRLTQAARERAAAAVVFGALPPDLGARLRALWEEFEAGETPAARFAMACDRAQGFLQGALGGAHWREAGVTEAETRPRMDPARAVDPAFDALIGAMLARARAGRMFAEDDSAPV